MDFLLERNANLNLGELELRLLKGSNLVHGFVGQGIQQARGKADHRAVTVLPPKTAIIVMTNAL